MSDPSTKSKPKQITTPEGITIIHNAQNQSRKRPQQSQPQAQQQPKQKQQQQPSFGNDIPVYDEELTKELRNTWIRDLDPKNISRDKVSKSLHFIPYGPPLVGTNGDDAYMATTKLGLSRQELLQFQNDDLSTLLRMDFYSFWSQVITDESLSDFLDSYLRHRKRPIDLDDDHDDATNSEAIRKLENDLFRRVFMVFLRLSSHLETTGSEEGDATVFQLPFNNYASMIYDLWIFDIAKLFDICGMYAPSNKDVTSSLVARVFLSQPEYYTNLQEAVPLICNSLDKVITQQQQQARNDSNTKQQQQQQQQEEDPQQQSKQQYDDYYDDDEMVSASAGKAKGKGKAVVAPKTAKTATSTQPFAEVAEIAEYLYDVSSTLRSFLETFTYGAFAFQGYQAPSSAPRRQTRGCNQQQHQHEPQHFDQKSTFLKYLVLCFEFVIPHLELYLKSSEDDGAGKNTRITVLLAALQAARENILAIAHVLLDKYYIQRIEQLPVVHNNIEFAKDAYFRTIFNSPTIASDLANLFAQQLQLLEEKSDRPRTGANRDALAKELHDMLTSLPSLATSELSDTAAPRRSKNQHQQPQSQPLEELIQRTSGTFLHEYNMRYRLFDRLQKWKNQKTGLDEASLDFALTILEGLELEMKNRAKQEAAAAAAPQPQQQQQQQQPTLDGGAAMPAEAALSSQLQAVRDLFPDLGEGYVYECLKYFDFNVESTINNMLENNLPLQLASMDKKKPLEKEQEQKAPFTTTTTTTTTTRQQLQLPSQASAATSRAEVSQQELQPAVKILPSSNTFVAPQLSSPTDLGGGPAWDKLFTGSLHLGKKKQAIDLPSKAETDAIRAKVLESIMYQDEYDDTFDEYLKFGVGEGDVNEGADDEPLSLSEMNRLRMYPPASVPQKQQQGQQRRPPQQQGQVQQQKPQSRQQQQPANQQQGHQQPRQQQDRGQPRQQQEKQQRSPRQQQQQRQRQRQQQAKDNIVDSEEEEEEDEEEEEEESSEENAERQQQQQQQQRPGGAPAGGASSSGPRNYRRKEANKAKIANHNRKIGAAKKMARSLGGSTSSGVFTK